MDTNVWHDGLFQLEDYRYDVLPEDAGNYSDSVENAYYDGFVGSAIHAAGLDHKKYRFERRRAHEGAIAAGHTAGSECYNSFLKGYLGKCFDDEYEAYLVAAARGRHTYGALLSDKLVGPCDHAWMKLFINNVLRELSPGPWLPTRACDQHSSPIPEEFRVAATSSYDCELCQFDKLLATASTLGSSVQFCRARAWLQSCDDTHSNDCSAELVSLRAPTRVIDVRSSDTNVLRLNCPTSDIVPKYAALSHCWGQVMPKEKSLFCTTTKNYKLRLQGFTVTELPKTFQDAICVTRQLDIPYIWIDSLCIIQGSSSDGRREAGLMETVFQSAYCTIAATSAISSYVGFLLDTNITDSELQLSNTHQAQTTLFHQDFLNDIDNVPLNKRAWVLQERILSRRTLHFSTNRLYFECGRGVYSDQTKSVVNQTFRGEHYFTADAQFPSNLLVAGHKRTLDFIQALYENYSRREMTYETDRCVAIAGLEARMARSKICSSFYSVFDQYLHRNLLWRRSDESAMEKINYKRSKVPSWSWMAYDGAIDFIDVPYEHTSCAINLRLWKAHRVPWSRKRKHSLSTDIGTFKNCKSYHDGLYERLHDSGRDVGCIWYDTDDSHDLSAERCVVTLREPMPDEKSEFRFYILVVKPTRSKKEYERVGAGWIRSDHVMREKENVRII